MPKEKTEVTFSGSANPITEDDLRRRISAVVIHGVKDEVIPFNMGEALARRLTRGRFVPLEGVGHNDIVDLPALLVREIREMLEKRAADPGVAESEAQD